MTNIDGDDAESLGLENVLDRLLSPDGKKREVAEARITENQNQPNTVFSLIAYSCTGRIPSVNEVISAPSESSPESHRESRSSHSFADDVKDVSAIGPESAARRALAAVLAKRIIRERWSTISELEKLQTKDLLLASLVNLPRSVLRTIHVVVASIAYQDTLLNGWPLLIPKLRYLLDQCRERRSNSAILDLLIVMASPDLSHETVARELLQPEHGVQEGLLFLAQGMKQLNIYRQKEVGNSVVPIGLPSCRKSSLRLNVVESVLRSFVSVSKGFSIIHNKMTTSCHWYV